MLLLQTRKPLNKLRKKHILKNQEFVSMKTVDKLPCISPNKIPETHRKKSMDFLTQKFDSFKDKIEKQQIPHDKMFFHSPRIELQQRCKIGHDQQIISMKLKQIENKLEQDCSEFEKISPRKKNVSRTHITNNNVQPSHTYLDQYNQMAKNLNNIQKSLQETDHLIEQVKSHPIDLLHYEELKKRPKVLNYLKSRNLQSHMSMHLEEGTQFNNTSKNLQVENHSVQLQKDYNDTMRIHKNSSSNHNAEAIIQRQFIKLFNMSNDNELPQQIKYKNSCKQLVKQQEDIVTRNAETISTPNKRKLQEKLNQIAREISKTDRILHPINSNSPMTLPKIPHFDY